ncbi:MAG: chorismate--pyruvate lyase family protein [Solirubrobacteraceae bacterium]
MRSTPWAVSASERPAAELLQSILRHTDGTVTEILATWAGETIGVETLEHRRVAWPPRSRERANDFSDRAVDALCAERGEPTVLRTSVLRGVDTGAPYLYARSAIVPRRLCAPLRSALDAGATPIGRLLLEHRVESIREILEAGVQRAGAVAGSLGVHEEDPLLTRIYRIVIGGQPAMLITEKLPAVRVVHEPEWEADRPSSEAAAPAPRGIAEPNHGALRARGGDMLDASCVRFAGQARAAADRI